MIYLLVYIVGFTIGYIAYKIYSRDKTLKGFKKYLEANPVKMTHVLSKGGEAINLELCGESVIYSDPTCGLYCDDNDEKITDGWNIK